MSRKGVFGLFGKKEEESKKVDIDKAKADKFLQQKVTVKKAKEVKKAIDVKKHMVVSGDTLSGIAKKYYDDAGKYMKIYEANKDVICDNPDLIQPGMELVIPNL